MSLLLTREVPLMNWTLLCQLIVLYFVFSVLGWMMEVTLKYIQYHRFINRGFLIGPYCPIYGSGVVLVTVLVGGLVGIRGGTPGEIFLAGFFHLWRTGVLHQLVHGEGVPCPLVGL